MKTATVLRHVQFEDLGSLQSVLEGAGYTVTYRNIGDDDFLSFDPLALDLLVVLGGPIGVYEEEVYPFLGPEKALIAKRLAGNKPTLGICLGAQLIAAASGAQVFTSGVKEIGFAPLSLTTAGLAGPLRHLDGVSVLHWHGDTYDLPAGAEHLASSALVQQQAFALGKTILGLQFHAEVDARSGFERWLVGHAHELASVGIDIPALRRDAERHGGALVEASTRLFREWLAALESP
ncbi:glutamine amidotransferase [Devosia sp.]|uniref:glutamine amidotransferase n=1 Tax=Devosia sp. TaxID=1871048 RepID=UPI0025D7C889|nr:glutamine amidotransferase [Devosia sp.]MCR6636397.1 glutamine amidotransferase [Devosia sp.]